jgi:hypothetical protein
LKRFDTSQLLPGDHLLYTGHSLIDCGIRLKTYSRAAHIEVYAGNGMSWASRNGIGVNLYRVRHKGLYRVLRPLWGFDAKAVTVWLLNAKLPNGKPVMGCGYGWGDLLEFFCLPDWSNGDGLICSEFAAMIDEHSVPDPQPGWSYVWNLSYPKGKIAPADFEKVAGFRDLYQISCADPSRPLSTAIFKPHPEEA